jgi:hypothetical protein
MSETFQSAHLQRSLIVEIILDEIDSEIRLGEDHTPRFCYDITNSVGNVFDAFNRLTKRVGDNQELTKAQKDVISGRLLLAPANARSRLDILEKNPQTLEQIITHF